MDWNPNDDFMRCNQGCIHWGLGGAAGLMLHHQDENGVHRYLMQQRSPYVEHGLTWAPPSGALAPGETPEQGAEREAHEEMGPFTATNHQVAHVADHGNWKFHTVSADTPHMFDPQTDPNEVENAAWLTPEEIDEMPLHPGFRQSWSELRPQPQQRLAMAADPYWLDDYVQRNGPYAWHNTSPEHVQSILQNGLLPWDHPNNRSESAYEGTPMEPRPNHVYLRNKPNSTSRPCLRVDLRKLDPSNLNPDEDWMDNDNPQVRRMWPNIPDEGPMFDPEGWEHIDEPSQTAWSMDQGGTIAHQGVIPPEAIDDPHGHLARVGKEDEAPQDDADPGAQILDALTMKSVAHQLHYKYEQAPLTMQEATEYAARMLDMIGYRNPDELTISTALNAWHQLYPADKQLNQGPAVQPQFEAPPTVPSASFGYGTISHKFDQNNFVTHGSTVESAVSAPPVPQLYHWTDAANLHGWMDDASTGPGSTYLTEHGDAPDDESWNPDVPMMQNPVRLTIDHNQLDPDGWDDQYHGWLNNYLYHGPIPKSAIKGIKAFPPANSWDAPEHWSKLKDGSSDQCRSVTQSSAVRGALKALVRLPENEAESPDDRSSTEPTPQDPWPDFGEMTNDQKHRDIQWGNSGNGLVE